MKMNNFHSTGFAKTGIFAFFVLFLLVINISAQKQSFTEDELKNLQSNAYEKLKTVSYRRITVRYNSGGRGFSSMSVLNFIPPNRSHTITQRKTAKGIVMEEWILIGEKAYYRKANEEWKVVTEENISGRGRDLEAEAGQNRFKLLNIILYADRLLKIKKLICMKL